MNDIIISNEDEETGVGSLDLIRLLSTLWKHKWAILAFSVAAMLCVFVKVAFFTPDTYTSRGELYVTNKNDVNNPVVSTSLQMNDIESARKMSESSVHILKTADFRDIVSARILEDSGKEYSAAYIGSHVSIAANETEILTVSVTTTTPEAAYDIASGFLASAPTHLKSIFHSGDAIVVDTPRLNLVPNSKGIARKLVITFLLGIVIGAAIVYVFTFFDKKVHSGTDAAKRYNLPLLGEIPR